ncbi:MAG: hypothetical protein ABH834_05390 [Candidatus Altiarchaeota archaeon]
MRLFSRRIETPQERLAGDMRSWLKDTCRNPVDTGDLLEKHFSGADTRGIHVPGEVSVVRLYSTGKGVEVDEDPYGNQVVRTCLGLRRTDLDPVSGEINQFWENVDGSEYPPLDKPGFYTKHPRDFLSTDDVTAYAKFHVVSAGEARIMELDPLQLTYFTSVGRADALDGFEALIDAADGAKARHELVNRRNLLLKSEHASVFYGRDRELVLAALALDAAEAAGCSIITLPTSFHNPVEGGNDAIYKRYLRAQEFMGKQTRNPCLKVVDFREVDRKSLRIVER